MKGVKKRILFVALVMSLAALFGLSGCIIPGIGGNTGAKAPQFSAKIDRTFITGSYDGSQLLVVDLNVENNSEILLPSSILQHDATATLDGKTLSNGYISDDNPNALPLSKSIEGKASGKAQLVFTLPDTKGTVELVIRTETIDFLESVEVLKESIDLAGVEVIVSESEFEVKINDVIVTDDGEGKNLLLLKITFANNSSESASFGSAIETKLFQKGIALKNGYLPYNHPATDRDLQSNSFNEIKGGASIDLYMVYELNNVNDPVELTCIDRMSYDNVTLLENTIEVKGSTSEKATA